MSRKISIGLLQKKLCLLQEDKKISSERMEEEMKILARKLLCFWLIIDYKNVTENSDFSLVMKANLKEDNSELEKICKLLKIDFDISENNQKLIKNLQKEIELLIEPEEDEEEDAISNKVDLEGLRAHHNKILDLTFVSLENDFMSFYQTNLRKRCSLCGNKQGAGHLVLCLFSGDTICFKNCPKKPSDHSNLYAHSLVKHSGSGIYLHCLESMVYVFDNTKCSFNESLYLNRIGEQIPTGHGNFRKEDFSEFVLNQQGLMDLRKSYLRHEMVEKIVQDILVQGTFIPPNRI